MDTNNRRKLTAVKEQLTNRAALVGAYTFDPETDKERTTENILAFYLQATLFDTARIVELLLEESE